MMVFLSGAYILSFSPIVVLAEMLARKLATHRFLPIVAIPVLGGLFPILGFVIFPGQWWPEEPFDMKAEQQFLFVLLALVSTGLGLVSALLINSIFPEEKFT